MSTAMQINRLSKVYDQSRVLKNLDLQIATGEVFGFFDHNDSGKMATLKIMATRMQLSSGGAKVWF